MQQAFLDYYRCPDRFANFRHAEEQSTESRPQYFKFGSGLTCYGVASVQRRESASDSLPDVLGQVRVDGSTCILPFNPTDVANNLRYERYVSGTRKPGWKKLTRS